jgi:hypothetical protein
MHYLDPTDGLKNVRNPAMDLLTVYDATSANLSHVTPPPGVKMAGYVTGSGGVPWTSAQWAAHPDAIRIDQSPVNTALDETADVLDVEHLAATLADIPQWVHAAWGHYHAATRPGQRTPTIYMNHSTMTPVANALVAAGITSGVSFWLAELMSYPTAAKLVTEAGGPYPVVGAQYEFNDTHDVSVVNAGWFANVSRRTPATAPAASNTVQVEHYQDGFGWVLDAHFTTPPTSRYRARVSAGQWSAWQALQP